MTYDKPFVDEMQVLMRCHVGMWQYKSYDWGVPSTNSRNSSIWRNADLLLIYVYVFRKQKEISPIIFSILKTTFGINFYNKQDQLDLDPPTPPPTPFLRKKKISRPDMNGSSKSHNRYGQKKHNRTLNNDMKVILYITKEAQQKMNMENNEHKIQ